MSLNLLKMLFSKYFFGGTKISMVKIILFELYFSSARLIYWKVLLKNGFLNNYFSGHLAKISSFV